MAEIQIAIINGSTLLDDTEISAAVPALQEQVHEHFAPIWGIDADLTFVPKGSTPSSGRWWLTILDDSASASNLGYHDLTSDGLPAGKVFADTDRKRQVSWTVTASHELLEMLGDPDVNLYAFLQNGSNSARFYSYETCDACGSDDQGYRIGDVLVSDFVYPSWFEGFRKTGSTQFDYKKLIDNPFELLPGGYAIVLDIPSGLGWYQLDGPPAEKMATRALRPAVGSRRERRMVPRSQWLVSTT